MTNILENKNNYLIIKDNDLIKLYSFKSLVSIYNTDTKIFEEVPYNFITINGTSSSSSRTTSRHINKFRKFIKYNFKGGLKC